MVGGAPLSTLQLAQPGQGVAEQSFRHSNICKSLHFDRAGVCENLVSAALQQAVRSSVGERLRKLDGVGRADLLVQLPRAELHQVLDL